MAGKNCVYDEEFDLCKVLNLSSTNILQFTIKPACMKSTMDRDLLLKMWHKTVLMNSLFCHKPLMMLDADET